MPTNQEWLHKLANESPDELKAWFDAEHNDDLAAEKVVSCDDAHSNDGNAHLKAHSKTELMLSEQSALLSEELDSREKLEADVRRSLGFTTKDVFGWLDRQAAITDAEWMRKASECRKYIEHETNELQKQVYRLTAERDSLAADLNDMMRSMDKLCDRFRDASSSALDNAHEIQRIIDNFWTV